MGIGTKWKIYILISYIQFKALKIIYTHILPSQYMIFFYQNKDEFKQYVQ